MAALASVAWALLLMLLPAPPADAQQVPAATAGVSSFEQRFQINGRRRRVLYLRPTDAAPGRAPVLVALHYGGGTPEAMSTMIRAEELVRDTGVWVILPDADGRAWDHDPRRDAGRPNRDVELITRAIDDAVGSLPVDPRRVYITGFSSGGFMAQRYACERPERVAAQAYVSATLLNTLARFCRVDVAMPTIGMHGTSDTRVQYGPRVGVASAPETARFYAERNGCVGAPTRTRLPNRADDGTTVDRDRWDNCATQAPVDFYTINRGGHTWPGNDFQVGVLGRISQDIDATQVIWDFVRVHRR